MSDQRMPSVEKLVALSIASDEIMQGILWRDRQGTLRTIVAKVHDLLDAESCAIFLVADDDRQKLVLETAYTDKWGNEFRPVTLHIQGVPKRGLTGYIAHQGELVGLHGNDLINNAYVAGRSPDHLNSGKCFSLLGIPLKDRKNRLIGLLKAENKKDLGDQSGPSIHFTEEDKSIAKILANKIVIFLETLHTSQILRGLANQMYAAKSVAEIFEACVKQGVQLLRADRGDLARWDEIRGDLIIEYQYGERGVLQGDPLPKRSIIRHVWNTAESRVVSTVATEPDYYCGNEKTESEIAVPLQWEAQKIGVLNLESFQKDSFDAHDIQILQLLTQHAVIAYRAIHKETFFRGIIEGLGQTSPPKQILTRILESVRGIYGFDGGLVYIADYTNRKLLCQAFISAKRLDIKAEEFSYAFNDDSLSTEVFRQRKPYFSADPVNDTLVNQKGLEAFHVQGSLLGVPLTFGEKALGVLVVWSSLPENSPEERHQSELQPFAQLAATAIALSATDSQRASVFGAIEKILYEMRTVPRREKLIQLILEGVQRAGFERARIFEYREDPARFVVVDSLGMQNPSALRGRAVNINQNPYARDTKDTAITNPSARVYDPSVGGVDPDAWTFEKSPDLVWAAVPLLVAGGLYGQVTADNAVTKKPISSEMLDYLTLMGALAAHVIESSQTIQVLHALASPIPFGSAAVASDQKLLTVKRVLVFLTAGETVGFNRALFLDFDDDLQVLRYYAGLSTAACEALAHTTPDSVTQKMTSVFDRAAEVVDSDLDRRLEGFTIRGDDRTAKALLDDTSVDEFSPVEIESWPKWMRDLAEQLGANHFLVASVRTENKIFGLLFVERRDQVLGEADKAALATSAQLTGLMLRQRLLQRFVNRSIAEAHSSVLRLQQRTITICFWDIRGFTDLCEKLKGEPTLISEFLKDYYNAATEIVETVHGGIIDKFIGDGVMALFGVLESSEKDDGANDAVSAALELNARFTELIDRWNVRWAREITVVVPNIKLGCGINTGSVLVGNVGTESRDQFTALGPNVNFASRIEGRSKEGEILISQPTQRRLNSSMVCEKVGNISDIPGIPGDHPIYEVKK